MNVLLFLRVAGILCIASGVLLSGMEMEDKLKRRWYLYREMYELLDYLEKEMTYHRSPIPEAFRNVSENCRTCLKNVLLQTAERIEKNEGGSFEEFWKEAVAKYIPEQLMPEEERQILYETSGALCSTDSVLQGVMLRKYKERFQSVCREAEKAYQEKGRLYRRLAAAAGVFLVLVLI